MYFQTTLTTTNTSPPPTSLLVHCITTTGPTLSYPLELLVERPPSQVLTNSVTLLLIRLLWFKEKNDKQASTTAKIFKACE